MEALADCTLSLTHSQSGLCVASAERDTELAVATKDTNTITINTTFTMYTMTDEIPDDLCCLADEETSLLLHCNNITTVGERHH